MVRRRRCGNSSAPRAADRRGARYRVRGGDELLQRKPGPLRWAAWALDKQLVLGLNAQAMVLLLLTFILSMLTFGTGRTNILFGLVYLVVFAYSCSLVFVP